MKKAVLALDQGTTSSRAILFDREGKKIAVAQKEFTQHFPQPAWVEHNAAEIWSTQQGVATEVLQKAGFGKDDVAAIGITNQRETTVLWDRKTGEPIHHAIVWQDRRTNPLCDELKSDGLESRFREKTGLILDPYFSGTKVRWLLDNVSGARERAKRGELAFGTIDSWILWNLTQGRVHATDPSNASRTLLYNIHTRGWDDDLLGMLDIPRSVLPEVKASSGIFGNVGGDGPLSGLPIGGMAGDQQSALFGQACYSPGMAKNTYGTGCFLLLNTGEVPVASKNRLLTTVAWEIDGKMEYALEGSVFVGGAVVQWLRDGLGIIKSSSEVEALAASVPDSGGVVMVPAFTGLGAPHWDPHARGLLHGITRGTTRAHIARAALEAIAHRSSDLLEAMQRDAELPLEEVRVDGGASANDLLMQFQADLLGVPVVRPDNVETTAFGAACLAGLATGYWNSRDEISGKWKINRRFNPGGDRKQIESARAMWAKAVERAGNWAV